MAEPNIVTANAPQNPTVLPGADKPFSVALNVPAQTFPDAPSAARLSLYNYYELLFLGQHYDAFNLRIASGEYSKAYSKLRYVMANFAGLVSKVVADMLFSEQVTIKAPDGDQEFIEGLWHDNDLDIQCYESALSNSYEGDALWKLRVGKRHPNDEENSVIIEDITPKIYFPVTDPFNTRAEPLQQVLAWVFKKGDKRYLRKEIHEPGTIRNEVYEMDGTTVKTQVNLDILGIPGLLPEEDTGIDDSLLVHIPNWKVGNRNFGISDYYDLDTLFFAINNRMTKVDSILDKHSDPILLVPTGILDEKGNVDKKKIGVIEIKEGENNKPEYVVWDASLENAFKAIEKDVELLMMVAEISPDVFGMGTGQADSGRALKYKLLRTIAKVARKKLYYYRGLQKVLYVAQKLAKEYGVKIEGKSLSGEPVKPDLRFADGLPIDEGEQVDNETKAIDAGITSTKDAIMRVYNVDEETAKKQVDEINKEKTIALPKMDLGKNPNPFDKKMPMDKSMK